MTLFANNNNTLTILKVLPLCKEKELQTLLEQNLLVALGVHFLASEYVTSNGSRIDTLGVDTDGAPCIIEYKRGRDDNVISQSLAYLKCLLLQRPEFFEKMMKIRLGRQLSGSMNLDWRNPRVICIAESFSQQDIDSIEFINVKIDLYTYCHYANGIFSLEALNTKGNQKNAVQSALCTISNIALIETLKNQNNASHGIREIFDKLRERILALDNQVVEKIGKRSVAYRLTMNFVEIQFRTDKIMIALRPVDFIDPSGKVAKFVERYLVTLNRRMMISSESELDYAVDIIEQSYANVL